MKPISANKLSSVPSYRRDGCYHEADEGSLKMRVLDSTRPTDEKFKKELLGVLQDEKETVSNKVYAVHGMSRIRSAETEDALIRIVSEKDVRLGFPALKTLGLTGTAKSFEALNKIRSLPFRSLERQKDFAALLIGYRLHLPGTDKILNRLLEDVPAGKKISEVPLRFQPMKTDDIETVLRQTGETDHPIALSRKTAFSLTAGGQTYYFLFTPGFENPANWQEALKIPQIAGLLFRKEKHTIYAIPHYTVLATPVKDHVQLNIFRKNGDLFMQGKVVYNKERNSFMVSNDGRDQSKTTEDTMQVDGKSSVSINLSYIRHQAKKRPQMMGSKMKDMRA